MTTKRIVESFKKWCTEGGHSGNTIEDVRLYIISHPSSEKYNSHRQTVLCEHLGLPVPSDVLYEATWKNYTGFQNNLCLSQRDRLLLYLRFHQGRSYADIRALPNDITQIPPIWHQPQLPVAGGKHRWRRHLKLNHTAPVLIHSRKNKQLGIRGIQSACLRAMRRHVSTTDAQRKQ
jgi:hypothetical protein